MNENKTNRVVNFGRDDPIAIARASSVLKEGETEPLEASSPLSDDEQSLVQDPEQYDSPRVSSRLLKVGVAAAGVAAAAGILLPRSGNELPPEPQSFNEHIQESVQKSYNPKTDELLIDNVNIKPNDPNNDTVSEAVQNNTEINAYKQDNPDEVPSLVTSAYSVPSAESYYVVGRDVDGDGDKDAIVVASE